VTDLRTERGTADLEPGHSADLPEPDERPSESPSAVPGVALTRLIRLARLSPAQALEIGASLLAEVARRSEQDTGSPAGHEVPVDRIVVGADGRVVLGPAAPDGGDGLRPSAAGSVGAVLADVVRAARLPTRRADPTADGLLAGLDRAVADIPAAGVPVVARRLREATDAIDSRAVREELAALVKALGAVAGSAGGVGAIGAPATVARAAPPGHTPTSGSRGAARRVGAWLASLLVLVAVVLLEVVLLRDDISTDIAVLLEAGRGGVESSAAPRPDGLPIEAPAPAAAGHVTAVDLRALAPCTSDVPCAVRLQVQLVPGAEQRVVTWSFRIVDRCTGATTSAPGGTVTVPAPGERVEAIGTVVLPKLQAVAVLAVTESPAAAASAPLLVGSCLSDRQAG
jgi:hypothetical protein